MEQTGRNIMRRQHKENTTEAFAGGAERAPGPRGASASTAGLFGDPSRTGRTREGRIMLIVGLMLVIGASVASAHEVHRDRGFYLGASIAGAGNHVDEDPGAAFQIKEDGGGLTLEAGYSFNQVFSLELVLAGYGFETNDPTIDGGIGAVQLFAHYQFRPGKQFRPFVKGGFGGYGFQLKQDNVSASINGGGLAFGGGVDYFFTRHFAMGFDLTHNIINYDELEFNFGGNTVGTEIDEEGALTTMALTFNFYF
jgi:opacity protein-like surface antigen